MCPDKTYLNNFTGAENFLLKSRTFALTMNDVGDNNINSCLIEYHPILEKQLKITGSLLNNPFLELIKVNISKRFILIKHGGNDELVQIYQSDIKDECIDKIKEDATIEIYDYNYYIIDSNYLTLTAGYHNPNIQYDWRTGSEYNKNLQI